MALSISCTVLILGRYRGAKIRQPKGRGCSRHRMGGTRLRAPRTQSPDRVGVETQRANRDSGVKGLGGG